MRSIECNEGREIFDKSTFGSWSIPGMVMFGRVMWGNEILFMRQEYPQVLTFASNQQTLAALGNQRSQTLLPMGLALVPLASLRRDRASGCFFLTPSGGRHGRTREGRMASRVPSGPCWPELQRPTEPGVGYRTGRRSHLA